MVPCITKLLTNKYSIFRETVNLLLAICRSVLTEPDGTDLRFIPRKSTTMLLLWSAKGGAACMFEMGYREDINGLHLDQSTPLDKMKTMHDKLERIKIWRSKKRRRVLSENYVPELDLSNINFSDHSADSSSEEDYTIIGLNPTGAGTKRELSALLETTMNGFLRSVIMHSINILRFENFKLYKEALKCINPEKFHSDVRASIRKFQSDCKTKKSASEDPDYQQFLVANLLFWFKNKFFKWVDKPPCDFCNSEKTEIKGHRTSTDSTPIRIEVYQCSNCKAEVLFHRHTDPSTLLRTRRGRCGEWADCFYLVCRAMGLEARIVRDETDHVWNEVYMCNAKKWVHIDPCEGIIDAPLLYENGWGKKITYVMAYSSEGVQDVTWRYTSNHRRVLNSRSLVSEEELLYIIMQIRQISIKFYTAARKDFIIKRVALELCDMLLEKAAEESELQGRISGSILWRRSRGEIKQYVWTFSKTHASNGRITVGYSPALDVYTPSLSGWEAGVYEAENMQVKVENDWKMAYLCRLEGCQMSKIAWRFQLNDDLLIDKIELKFPTATFHSGKVKVTLCSDSVIVDYPDGGECLKTDSFANLQSLQVTAVLSGGEGNTAWQHSQLFRQPISDKDRFPFLLNIFVKLKKGE